MILVFSAVKYQALEIIFPWYVTHTYFNTFWILQFTIVCKILNWFTAKSESNRDAEVAAASAEEETPVVHAARAASSQSKEQQSILFQRDWVITEAEILWTWN